MRFADRLAIAAKNKVEAEVGRRSSGKSRELSALGKILKGDADSVLDSALDEVFANAGIGGTRIPTYRGGFYKPSKLLGGLTLTEARKIAQKVQNADYAKKNLFHVSVANLSYDDPLEFNLFVVDLSYSLASVSGDSVQIGSGTFDIVNGKAPVELRFTTFDNRDGDVKKWFMNLKNSMCHTDGTFGLPIDYLTRITITHGFVTDQAVNAFQNSYVMRATSMDIDKSRRDDALEELQITFTEFDTFSAL